MVVGQILVGPNHDFGGDAGIIGTTAMTIWLGSTLIVLWRLSRNRRVSSTTLRRYGLLSTSALFTGLGCEVVLALFKVDGTPLFRNLTGTSSVADFALFLGWGVLALFWYRNHCRGLRLANRCTSGWPGSRPC